MGQRQAGGVGSLLLLMVMGGAGALPAAAQEATPTPQDAAPAGTTAVLGDLRFGAAYVRARGLSPELNEAVAALAAAQSVERGASAQQYPQLGFKADVDWVHQHVDGDYFGFQDIDRSDTFDRYAYGLALNQPVYRPEVFKGVDLAKLHVTATEYALDEVETKVALQLATEYFAVIEALEALRAKYAELSSTAEQQRQTETRYSAGLAKESDMALVRAARASAEADRIDAEDAVQAARLKLGLTVGGDFRRVAVLAPQTPLPKLAPADLDTWVKTALDKRPALAEARAGVQAARVSLDIAKTRRLPRVDLVGSHAWFDANGGVSGGRTDQDDRIGLELTLPLFTGGAINAEISRAEAKLAQATAAAEGTELRIKSGVQRAWMGAASAYRQIGALQRAVQAGLDAERASKVGLDVGTETTADYLLAVRRRYFAERDYAHERLTYLLAVIQLKAVAGTLMREDIARTELLLKFPEAGWPSAPALSPMAAAPEPPPPIEADAP